MRARSRRVPSGQVNLRAIIEAIEPRVLLHGGHSHDHAHSEEMFTKLPAGSPSPEIVAEPTPVETFAPGDQKLPDTFPLISQSDGYVHGWSIDENEIPGRTLLRLTTAVANAGAGAMELRGGTVNPDGTQNVHQRIYLEGGGFTDRLAGTFSYHPGHGHIHFDGFAAYHLRAVTPGDGVGAIVASGDKVSFCLLDIDRYNPALPGSPTSSVYNSCGQVQGISVGWADVYDKSLDDQWIDVTGMTSGRYWLEVVSDPDNHLVESNETNNVDRILIDLAMPTSDPIVVSHHPAGQSLTPVSFVDFQFKERINTSSFSIIDDIAGFTGPGGVDLRSQMTGYSWSNLDTKLRVTFNTQSAAGAYAMTLGPQILALDNGNPMDQDTDGTPGEAIADRYTGTFSIATHLGPDGFGYRATAHPFQGINLVPGGAGVFSIHSSADDSAVPVNLGANTFNFYGVGHSGASSLYVSTNGLITFGSSNSDYMNTDLTTAPSQRAIAPLWDDWQTNLTAADQVLGKFEDTNGDGTTDRLIIEWSDVPHYSASPSPATFQAILQLNTGSSPGVIIFNYVDLETGDATRDGAQATVGIKDAGNQGSRRLLISADNLTPIIGSGKAIRIVYDVTAPQVTGAAFSATPQQRLTFTFTEDIITTSSNAGLVLNLLNQTTGAVISGAAMSAAGSTLTFTFPGLPQGLPDGNYRARLLSGAVSDGVGNAMNVHHDLQFFFLAGDANLDRHVNEADRAIFDTHIGQAGTFADGDFNYSGAVDGADQVILDAAWRKWLPPQGGITLHGTAGADTYLLRLESESLLAVHDSAAPGAPPHHRIPMGALSSVSFNGGDGTDTLIVDYSNGVPVPEFGVSFSAGAGDDALTIIGSAAADIAWFSPNAAQVAFRTTSHSGVERITFAGNGGLDSVEVTAGSSVRFDQLQRLGSLMIRNGALVSVAAGAGGLATQELILEPSARLDMADNDVLVHYAHGAPNPYARIRQYIVSGRDTGFGIFATPAPGRVLAPVDNARLGRTEWLGGFIDTTTIICMYTYYGDSNFDGKVTGDDYVAIDSNLGRTDAQWIHGDFNFDGRTSGDDYVSIDANLGLGTADTASYDELQAEMIALHADRYGGKRYVHAVEQAAEDGKKPRPQQRGGKSMRR